MNAVLAFLEGPDLIIVLVLLLVLFGGSQLPKLAKNLGEAQRELKKGLSEGNDDTHSPSPLPPPNPPVDSP
jgi:sec-independent protein translocase protein TatA